MDINTFDRNYVLPKIYQLHLQNLIHHRVMAVMIIADFQNRLAFCVISCAGLRIQSEKCSFQQCKTCSRVLTSSTVGVHARMLRFLLHLHNELHTEHHTTHNQQVITAHRTHNRGSYTATSLIFNLHELTNLGNLTQRDKRFPLPHKPVIQSFSVHIADHLYT